MTSQKRRLLTKLDICYIAYFMLVFGIPIGVLKNQMTSKWLFSVLEHRNIPRIYMFYAWWVYVMILSAGMAALLWRNKNDRRANQ